MEKEKPSRFNTSAPVESAHTKDSDNNHNDNNNHLVEGITIAKNLHNENFNKNQDNSSLNGNVPKYLPSVPQQEYHFEQNPIYNLSANVEGAPIMTYEEVFPRKTKYNSKFNDWPFTLFFIFVFCAFIVLSSLTLRAWSQNYSQQGHGIYTKSTTNTMNTNSAILLIFVCCISLVFAITGLVLCRLYPRFFIISGIILNILSGLGTSIMYLSLKYWSAGIVFLVFTLFIAFCFCSIRSRIPLATIILEIVIDGMKTYPQTLIVSILGTIISGAFAILFSLVIVATYMKYDPDPNNPGCNTSGGSCSNSKLIGLLVLVFFCGYYISEVIKNVIHSTISGIYGCWYFMSKADQSTPKGITMGSFKRAMSTSFGSICFGSLIVSLIETFRQTLTLIRNAFMINQNFGNISHVIFWIIDLIIGFLRWLVQYFNHYAYSFIALYGESYLNAAKQTWQMIREKGLDAIINDNLINTALTFYGLFVSYIAALFAFLYLRFTKPSYNDTGGFNGPLIAFSFVIALQICNIATEIIRSGTATFFIALGSDPEIFQQSYPEKFNEIFNAYPQVLEKFKQHSV